MSVQSDLEREVLFRLTKRQKGASPIIVAGLCPTNTAFTGQLAPSLGVMRNGQWVESDSAVLGQLADYFPSLSACLDWLKKITRNKTGQSILAIDARSMQNWGIDS